MNSPRYSIPLERITTFLKADGWKPVDEDNERWFVFEGESDIEGDLFEIVIPKKASSPEYPIYVQHTVDILASLSDRPHDVIAEEIRRIVLDEMVIKFDVGANANSLPTDAAAEYMAEIDQVIVYAATSEKSRRQHYDRPTSRVREMVKDIRLGHTVSGSFGFRVEAKIFDASPDRQLSLPGIAPKPITRSVMERIVRGLAAAEKAVAENHERPLVEGYATGFNSRMCESIAKISSESGKPVQYSMKWSKTLGASEDLQGVKDITIHNRHVDYLKRARDQLAFSEPHKEYLTVVGRVIGFLSHDDPHSDSDEGRTVTIYASPRGERDRQIQVELGKKDYLAAMKAHDAWQTISITGVLSKPKSRWELAEPHNLRVLH